MKILEIKNFILHKNPRYSEKSAIKKQTKTRRLNRDTARADSPTVRSPDLGENDSLLGFHLSFFTIVFIPQK